MSLSGYFIHTVFATADLCLTVFGPMIPGVESNGGKLVAGAESWEIMFQSHTGSKETIGSGAGLWTPKAHHQWHTSFSKAPSANASMTSPKSTTNWWPSVVKRRSLRGTFFIQATWTIYAFLPQHTCALASVAVRGPCGSRLSSEDRANL